MSRKGHYLISSLIPYDVGQAVKCKLCILSLRKDDVVVMDFNAYFMALRIQLYNDNVHQSAARNFSAEFFASSLVWKESGGEIMSAAEGAERERERKTLSDY